MKTTEIVNKIHALCSDETLDFVERTKHLYGALDQLGDEAIHRHIEDGGMIPENIDHDSSEEKLFAKYCDYLLARGLTLIGIPAKPIPERSDAADVHGKTDNPKYEIVGDAKAFRLSRTAKNQKDFKVDALNRWKNGAKYAVLLGPLYQYPSRSSQIYHQAIEKSVSLFSYTHLAFLIASKESLDGALLERVWHQFTKLPLTKDAQPYWEVIDGAVCDATKKSRDELKKYKRKVLNNVCGIAQEQLTHWEDRKITIKKMDADQVREELIRTERIDSNISTINSFIEVLKRGASL